MAWMPQSPSSNAELTRVASKYPPLLHNKSAIDSTATGGQCSSLNHEIAHRKKHKRRNLLVCESHVSTILASSRMVSVPIRHCHRDTLLRLALDKKILSPDTRALAHSSKDASLVVEPQRRVELRNLPRVHDANAVVVDNCFQTVRNAQ